MYRVDKINKERKRVMFRKRLFNVLIYIILIPIIIVNCIMIGESFFDSSQTPSIGGLKFLSIVSGSMEPNINTGDLIIIKETNDESELSKDDIITYNDGNTKITHRIVDVTYENGIKKYTTKGDNNNVEDRQKVNYENIEGKYVTKINKGGYLLDILKSPITLVILIIVLVLNYLYRKRVEQRKLLRKEIRKKHNEEREIEE